MRLASEAIRQSFHSLGDRTRRKGGFDGHEKCLVQGRISDISVSGLGVLIQQGVTRGQLLRCEIVLTKIPARPAVYG
jgi:hypothetical protein